MPTATPRRPSPMARGIFYAVLAALVMGVVGAFVMHEGGPGLAGFGRALRGGAVVAFGVPVSALIGFALGVLHGRRRLSAWQDGVSDRGDSAASSSK